MTSKKVKNNKPILQIKRVSKKYGNVTALKSVSLELKSGTIHAILGPNGSGKTTLLRTISGLVVPDSGQVMVDSQKVSNKNLNVRKKIVIVPDEDDIIDDLTPLEYLQFVASLYDMDRLLTEERIEQILQLVDLWDSRNRLCRGFSHGMRKKVQLSAALLPKAKLFIIDEPTNGIDPDVIILVKEILTTLKQNGYGVLLATHNLSFAQSIADSVTLLSQKVYAQGPVKQILSKVKAKNLEDAYMQLTKKKINHEAIKAIITD